MERANVAVSPVGGTVRGKTTGVSMPREIRRITAISFILLGIWVVVGVPAVRAALRLAAANYGTHNLVAVVAGLAVLLVCASAVIVCSAAFATPQPRSGNWDDPKPWLAVRVYIDQMGKTHTQDNARG